MEKKVPIIRYRLFSFLQYFEEVVVPEQCDPDLSVLENKVNSSDSFFDSSCKPGPWSPETGVDQKLSGYLSITHCYPA